MKTQISKIGGKRVKIKTSAKGKVTISPAGDLEENLQAAQCVSLRMSPGYGKLFLFAGDQNAERRGPKAQAKAVKTGMMAGEPDLRLYFNDGRVLLIENKTKMGKLTNMQIKRHKELASIGHNVVVIRSETPQDAVKQMWDAINQFMECGH